MRAPGRAVRRERRLEALVLEQQTHPPPDSADTVSAMLDGVRELGLAALPWDRDSRTLQARMQFVRALARNDLHDWPRATMRHWQPISSDG